MTAHTKAKTKAKTPDFDLSDFALDDSVSLEEAATDLSELDATPRPAQPAATAAAPAPVAPGTPSQKLEPPVVAIASPVTAFLPPAGRANRVALTFWVTPELRRAIRQSMIGSLEGVYRTQGDLVEAAVRKFLNLG